MTFSLPAGTAPLGVGTGTLRQQGIVGTPNVIRYSKLQIQGFDSTGVRVVLTGNAVPVVENCG